MESDFFSTTTADETYAKVVLPPHGKIELVSHCASDLDVVNAARVSVQQESNWEWDEVDAPAQPFGSTGIAVSGGSYRPRLSDKDKGLIRYLMNNKHGTPFEHNFFKFRVKAPIFVFREWHRHRIGCCVTGDAVVDFVDINGTKGGGALNKTLSELWDRWEGGEIVGNPSERLSEALAMVERGTSVRTASVKTGVARGTIDRHKKGLVTPGKRGSRWRVEGMRIRVLDEETGRFKHSHIKEVMQSGVKEVYWLRNDRGVVKVTAEHPMLTPNGWVSAGDLKKGDLVGMRGRVAKHSTRQIPPRLREGIALWTQGKRDELLNHDSNVCYVCGDMFMKQDVHLDHVVPVVENIKLSLDVDNLKPCCEGCHRVKTNGEQALARRGTAAGCVFEPLHTDPEFAGEEMTYDLYVADHHNFVANGFVVHNSINEASARYSVMAPDFYVPESFRIQKGKPGAYVFEETGPEPHNAAMMESAYKVAYETYEYLMNKGVAKEQARAVLPVGLMSEMYWSCNSRSLMAFLELRNAPQALKEIKVYAEAMEEIFATVMPQTANAFILNGRVAP